MPWDAYRYAWFAEQYGWPPDVVDKLPLRLSDQFMPISGAIGAERRRREAEAFNAK